MNKSDQPTLAAIVGWFEEHPADDLLTARLAEIMNSDLSRVATSVHRLLGANLVEAIEMNTMGSPIPSHIITGVTGAGLEAHERASIPLATAVVKPAEGPRYGDVHIHIEGSTVGQLNLGQVVGNIETHLNAVSGATADELKSIVAQLVEAVAADERLSEGDKRDVLLNIDYLSEEAAAPTGVRKLWVVKAVLYWMGWTLGAGGSAVTVWEAAHPVLHRFFGV